MKLTEVLDLADKSNPEYSEKDIIEALQADEPYLSLKGVFERSFFPKVERWIDKRLAKVKVDSKAKELVGGELKAKLDKELNVEKGEREYNINTEIFARELLNSIEKWNQYENKPFELPLKPGI